MEFKSYDSFEEMQEDMDRAKKAADARIRPHQRLLTYGDHFVRFVELDGEPMAIYNCVVSLEVHDRSDRASVRREMKEGSFMFCRAFSVIEPTGELGSVHRSTADIPITVEQFRAFEQAEWPTDLVTIRYILGGSNKTPGTA